MRLIVIRHGESVYNDQKRFTGQADVPLSPLGKRQAAALGERLAGEHLDAIVSSDLLRARDTAEAIASYHALPVYEDSDLRELALGEWKVLPSRKCWRGMRTGWRNGGLILPHSLLQAGSRSPLFATALRARLSGGNPGTRKAASCG
jgi:broad specificity phosphatase PhoE